MVSPLAVGHGATIRVPVVHTVLTSGHGAQTAVSVHRERRRLIRSRKRRSVAGRVEDDAPRFGAFLGLSGRAGLLRQRLRS